MGRAATGGGNKNRESGVYVSGGTFVLTPQQKLRRFDDEIAPHLGAAYNLARWLTGSREDAEDVVQEAFLRAFSALGTLRGAAKPWVLTIVRNTAITWRMRRGNPMAPVADEEAVGRACEPGAGPEALAVAAGDRERVRRALGEIGEEFREAIVLRELEGMSYKEIAEVTGVPMGTVMSRLSRGREWLKRRLTSGIGAGEGR
ncbi:MAG: polymerase sigma factor [Candidatus Solibacter sp.]|nr:polymerase sigma factor [Candidatus Solibacter sp.]